MTENETFYFTKKKKKKDTLNDTKLARGINNALLEMNKKRKHPNEKMGKEYT